MAMKLTADQQNAVDARGNSVLVSAAAGSGKTAVLCKRAAGILADTENPVSADRLLIVTFTNAAADEMRRRISQELDGKIKESPNNTWLMRQQLLLPSASICTIDAFCLKLLRDNFYKAQVSPDFRTADENTVKNLSQKAMDATLVKMYREDYDRFTALCSALGNSYDDKNVTDAVLELSDFLDSLCFPEEWITRALDMYKNASVDGTAWEIILKSYVGERISSCISPLEIVIGELSNDSQLKDKLMPYAIDVFNSAMSLADCVNNRTYDDAVNAIKCFDAGRFPSIRGVENVFLKDLTKIAIDEIKSAVKEAAELYCVAAEEAVSEMKWVLPHIETLFEVYRVYSEKLSHLKAEKNLLTFADIERRALELLVTYENGEIKPTSLARELSDHYFEVLADEYQDTNELQDTVFRALSDGGKRLFIVGDAKQSIYRFRKANPEIFITRREEYPLYDGKDHPSVILLGANFRSRRGITDFVNYLFSHTMSKSIGNINYNSEEELVCKADYPAVDSPCTELHIIQKNGVDEPQEIIEGRHTARLIKTMIEGGFEVRDGRTGEMRPAEYGDFCILMRNASRASIPFAKELENAGIPVCNDASDGFLDRKEVIDAVSLMRVTDNPVQDVPMLTFLLSPFCSFTVDRIATIRAENPAPSIYASMLLSAEKGETDSVRFTEMLNGLRRRRFALSAADFLRVAFQESGYIGIVSAADNKVAADNMQALIGFAESYGSENNCTVSDFVRYIDKMQAMDADFSKRAVPSANAVRIMTIHRSKGLQAPVCILAATTKRFRSEKSDKSVLLSEKNGIGLKIVKNASRFPTIPFSALGIAAEQDSISEEMRLLYVALTRAEEKLIMLATVEERKSNGEDRLGANLARYSLELLSAYAAAEDKLHIRAKSYADWIIPCAMLHADGKILREACRLEVNPTGFAGTLSVDVFDAIESAQTSADERPMRGEADEAIVAEVKRRLDFVYPYAGLNTVFAKNSASALAHGQGDDYAFTERPAFLSSAKLTPAQRGTALHLFIEKCDFKIAEKTPEEELRRLVEAGVMSTEQSQAVDMAGVAAFFGSDLYARMKCADKLYRERNFAVLLPAGEVYGIDDDCMRDEQVVIQGAADCVFEENGWLVIVDYKTDRCSDVQVLAERYQKQLDIYANVFSRIYGLPVKDKIIYSFYRSEYISIK